MPQQLPILSPEQTTQLLLPVAEERVAFRQGLAHMEAYELRAHLNRVFGFAQWSEEVLHYRIAREEIAKDTITVVYEAQVRVRFHGDEAAVYTEVAVAGDTGQRSNVATVYHRALTSAVAAAFKRACSNLGDQFGLSLYGDGSIEPIVRQIVGNYAGDVQAGAHAIGEEVAQDRLAAKNELRDAVRNAKLDPAAVNQQFLTINGVDVNGAHASQVREFTQRIRAATAK